MTEREQAHVLGTLIEYGCVWMPLVIVFIFAMKEFRNTRALSSFFGLAAFLVLYGGVWSWFGYFGDHGAFFTWPVIVLVVFFVLIAAHWWAADNRRKAYVEKRRNEFPELPDIKAGPSNLRDFEDWK